MSPWLSSTAGKQIRFETTQWSLVSAAGEDEERWNAFEGLYRSYCSTVYSFIRRRGYNRQDAQDLTQDFFIHLVEKNAFRRADPNRGKFRTFLLGSLGFFLQHASQRARAEKRGGQASVVFLDDETAEAYYQLADPGLTAEQVFDARWARTLIENALNRLQTEMERAGKRELYDQLLGFVVDAEKSSYFEVGQRAGLTTAATKAAIYRLRERYRELLRDEVARTVTSSADFELEIRELRSLLDEQAVKAVAAIRRQVLPIQVLFDNNPENAQPPITAISWRRRDASPFGPVAPSILALPEPQMNGPHAIPEESTCLRCHESIGADESYSGYCLGCLLLAALPLDQVAETESNRQFGPYELLVHPDGSFVELGRGSMGITYEALDTNLYSSVALKVIHSETAAREKNRERFLREARAAARLRHPHVANVLYYGVREDGQCFYAMELVEGETLAQRVRRHGPLPIKDALEVMSQVASALEATEKSGVVHRDLKPANLMLVNGPGINVKVIDFGLAKIVGNDEPLDQITHDGFIGTPAFASPEQLSGGQIDQRSDYYSVGSTLYYLLTGKPPFAAEGIDELAKRIDCQNSLADLLKDSSLPASVQSLLRSLLSADLNNRPQSGKELAEAVSECQYAMAKPRPRRVLLVLSIIGATALTSTGLLFWSVAGQNTPEKSIAVLPFENLGSGSDKAYFADGVQDEILTHLARVADLKVISRDSVKAYRDPVHRPSPPEIGKAMHVNYLVSGSIQRDANRIRATVRIIEAKTGRELWAEHYDGEPADIFAIQTQIAEVISRELRAKLSTAEKASIEEVPTHDVAAYELYLHARELLWNYDEATQGWEPLYTAVRSLEEAVSRDPNFALAWLQLSRMDDTLYWFNADRSDSRRQAAETALQKALSLRPDLGENHLRLASHLLTTGRDYPAIIKELEIARRSLPNSANLFTILADVELHRGQWHDALQDLERASTLDPRNLSLLITRGNVYQYHRQYEQLQQTFDDAAVTWASAESIQLQKALSEWQANGDTSPLHALLDEPAGPLRAIGRATILKLICAVADRDFAQAEKILAADPKQEFEGGNRRFVCKDFLLGGIKAAEGDNAAAQIAYAKARPLQLAYVNKWPDDPNSLIVLAATDASLGNKEEAFSEGRRAAAMQPIAEDAVDGPILAKDLAGIYLLAGERELAMEQLESLAQVPRALNYGELAKLPEWDVLRGEPRFQKLLSDLKPIPIVNRLELGKN